MTLPSIFVFAVMLCLITAYDYQSQFQLFKMLIGPQPYFFHLNLRSSVLAFNWWCALLDLPLGFYKNLVSKANYSVGDPLLNAIFLGMSLECHTMVHVYSVISGLRLNAFPLLSTLFLCTSSGLPFTYVRWNAGFFEMRRTIIRDFFPNVPFAVASLPSQHTTEATRFPKGHTSLVTSCLVAWHFWKLAGMTSSQPPYVPHLQMVLLHSHTFLEIL